MADSVSLAGITISLVDGYPICSNNIQTWRYSVAFVSGPPTPGISNFAFALCNPEHNVVDFSPEEGAEYDENNAQPCLRNQFGTTRQMKWNRSNNNVVGEYEFSLAGCFESCDINVAVHTGLNLCHFGVITGPCCTPLNGGRGIDFSNFKNITIEY